ncbi:rod shape-determining protein MreC [Oscillospiraceae bacterium MB08-C2-2]|nr:rod shape-determining protein MreC [Oscillospiraceae bacterium MB08-C2-2]
MKDFLSSVRFKILLAVLALLVGFMIQAVYTGGTAPLLSQIFSFITTPLQQASASLARSAGEFFDKFLRADEIAAENEFLRQQVNSLRENQVEYDRMKHENEQFREILGVKEKLSDLEIEMASVIARDPSDRFYSFMIGKGSVDGISPLDPVMTPDGLVGYVSEVGATYSKVITLLDVSIDVGAFASAARDIGIVSGTVEMASQGMCQMEYLPRESTVAKGDLILTSGGALYPKDLVIGVVEDVRTSSHGTSLVASIKPAADIRNVKDVVVITHFEGQGLE